MVDLGQFRLVLTELLDKPIVEDWSMLKNCIFYVKNIFRMQRVDEVILIDGCSK